MGSLRRGWRYSELMDDKGVSPEGLMEGFVREVRG